MKYNVEIHLASWNGETVYKGTIHNVTDGKLVGAVRTARMKAKDAIEKADVKEKKYQYPHISIKCVSLF